MVIKTLFLGLVLAAPTFACSAHPGMTHEQWTSAVADERNKKTGAVTTISDGFFSTPVSTETSYEDRGRGRSSRPIDDSGRRR